MRLCLSSRAVSKIMGIWLIVISSLMFMHSSYPFIRGIITSLTMISGMWLLISWRASTPSAAMITRLKDSSSVFFRKSVISGLSSTTRMVYGVVSKVSLSVACFRLSLSISSFRYAFGWQIISSDSCFNGSSKKKIAPDSGLSCAPIEPPCCSTRIFE